MPSSRPTRWTMKQIMAYSRDEAFETHKDYKENVNQWEYYIRSFNGGYDYTLGQYLNRYNLE